jgi:ABC-type glutathione transport system ATPase component
VEHLAIRNRKTDRAILTDLSFTVQAGEVFALIGESGEGKTITGMALMGILDPEDWEIQGSIIFEGQVLLSPLTGYNHRYLDEIRGRKISMIFQEHASFFHPFLKISQQIIEAVKIQQHIGNDQFAYAIACEKLKSVGFPIGEMDKFPHELSSGQRQRAMIAMCMLQQGLIISDEATSSLDPILKKQISTLYRKQIVKNKIALILITHEVRMLYPLADRMILVEKGRAADSVSREELFDLPGQIEGSQFMDIITKLGQDLDSIYALKSLYKLHEPSRSYQRQSILQIISLREFERILQNPLLTSQELSVIKESYVLGKQIYQIRQPLPREDEKILQAVFRKISDKKTRRKIFKLLEKTGCRKQKSRILEMMLEDKEDFFDIPRRRALADEKTVPYPQLLVKNLVQYYEKKSGWLQRSKSRIEALSIDFALPVYPGEILGIVGESGCGKTTFMKSILRVGGVSAEGSSILFEDQDLIAIQPREKLLDTSKMKKMREKIQAIFQDSDTSFNPALSIYETLEQIIRSRFPERRRAEIDEEIKRMLAMVNLRDNPNNSPQTLSGGNKKKLAIACSLVVNPQLIIADEPFSGLDIVAKRELIQLFMQLQKRPITVILISHDLDVVKNICHRMAVFYMGQVVEIGLVQDLFLRPVHPYTHLLITSLFTREDMAYTCYSRQNFYHGCRYFELCQKKGKGSQCSATAVIETTIRPQQDIDLAPRRIRCTSDEIIPLSNRLEKKGEGDDGGAPRRPAGRSSNVEPG